MTFTMKPREYWEAYRTMQYAADADYIREYWDAYDQEQQTEVLAFLYEVDKDLAARVVEETS